MIATELAGTGEVIDVARAGRRACGGYLHAWVVPIDSPHDLGAINSAVLSADERERARGFVTPAHGAAFATCRVLLRVLLGAYLDLPAPALHFRYGPQGKPMLASDGGAPLSFNVSHTDGLFIVVITPYREVGVDVEFVRPARAYEDIARQFFSPPEVRALFRLDPEQRARAFHQCWTRKEAFVKACGEGMALPPHRFTVACPSEPAELLSVEDDRHEASRWILHDLDVGSDHVATVAVEKAAPPLELRYWNRRWDSMPLSL